MSSVPGVRKSRALERALIKMSREVQAKVKHGAMKELCNSKAIKINSDFHLNLSNYPNHYLPILAALRILSVSL